MNHAERFRIEKMVAAGGWLLATLFLFFGAIMAFPTENHWQRLGVVLCVASALLTTWAMMRYVSYTMRSGSRTSVGIEVGVLIFFLFVIALAYSGAYAQLGILYASGEDELRTLGIDWISQAPIFRTHPVDAMYFSLITLATVGYGDFRPSPEARDIAALQGINGVIALGIVVAYFTARLERRRL